MAACTHEIEYMGMCTLCGEDMEKVRYVRQRHGEDVEEVAYSETGIVIKRSTAQKVSLQQRVRLIAERRLALVLDLDKTLLHATVDSGASVIEGNFVINYELVTPESDGVPPPDAVNVVARFCLSDTDYFVKFRPGLMAFLDKMAAMYELSVFTAGTRPYAEAIVKIIDPTKALFSQRVISRDDISDIWKPGRQVFKSLERVFPFDDSFAVILDDSPGVWSGNLDNLLQVMPYTYFTGMKEVNVFANTSEATNPKFKPEDVSSPKDSRPLPAALTPVTPPEDDQLVYAPIEGKTPIEPPTARKLRSDHRQLKSLGYVLIEAHKRFFARGGSVCVKPILVDLKTCVFEGVHMCFSGVIRRNQAFDEHPMVLLAQRFGATVHKDFTDAVTHMIANNPKTEKAQHALSVVGTFIVKPGWVRDSTAHFHRQSEAQYALKGTPYLVTHIGYADSPASCKRKAGAALGMAVAPVKRSAPEPLATLAPKRHKPLPVQDYENEFLDDFF